MSRIVPDIDFLKDLTPFGFANGVDVWSASDLNAVGLIIACCLTIVALSVSFILYHRKDLNG